MKAWITVARWPGGVRTIPHPLPRPTPEAAEMAAANMNEFFKGVLGETYSAEQVEIQGTAEREGVTVYRVYGDPEDLAAVEMPTGGYVALVVLGVAGIPAVLAMIAAVMIWMI